MIYRCFANGMIGHLPPFSKYFYFDTEETRYHKDIKDIPDWRYKDIPITYEYNSHGHRSKEISELGKKYILFNGCSHTEGHAMPIEETYAYMLSKDLNMDYYNLALKGNTVNTTYYNLSLFLAKAKVKPKLVVIQWPHFNRLTLIHQDKDPKWNQYGVYTVHRNPGMKYDDTGIYKLLDMNNVPMSHSYWYRHLTLELLSNYKIPIVEINGMSEIEISPYEPVKTTIVSWPGIEFFPDLARDHLHAGPLTNRLWADKILESLDKKFLAASDYL